MGADLTIGIAHACAVAQQPTDFGMFTHRICRRDRIARCQESQLHAAAGYEGSRADEKRVRALAHKRCECRSDLAAAVDVVDLDLQPHGMSSRFDVSQRALGRRTGRVVEHGYSSGCGDQLAQQFQPLCSQLSPEHILMPVRLPPGRAKLATRPSLTGSSAARKTMGIVVVVALAANAAGGPPVAAITATLRPISSAASAGNRSI